MDKKEEEEEEVDDDELIVWKCLEVWEEAAEKGTFSDECQDEDEVDMEEASDSSDVAILASCAKYGKNTLLAINWKGNYNFYTVTLHGKSKFMCKHMIFLLKFTNIMQWQLCWGSCTCYKQK